jgi:hypothetical protein
MHRLLFFSLTFLLPLQGISQGLHKNTLKVKLSGISDRHFQVAWERSGRNKNRTFDLQFGIKFEQLNSYHLSKGTVITNYFLTQYDSSVVYSNSVFSINNPVWRLEDGTSSLPDLPEKLPAYTAYLKFGHRSYLNNVSHRFRFFVQPGYSIYLQRGYLIKDAFTIIWEKESTYQSVTPYTLYQITKRYRYYEERRHIGINYSNWFVGLHVDTGLRLRVWKNLMLEAQVLAGINIAKDDETIIRSELVKQYGIGYKLNAGWQF